MYLAVLHTVEAQLSVAIPHGVNLQLILGLKGFFLTREFVHTPTVVSVLI